MSCGLNWKRDTGYGKVNFDVKTANVKRDGLECVLVKFQLDTVFLNIIYCPSEVCFYAVWSQLEARYGIRES